MPTQEVIAAARAEFIRVIAEAIRNGEDWTIGPTLTMATEAALTAAEAAAWQPIETAPFGDP